MSDRIVMILAEGFEEIEAVATADVLKRIGFDLTLAGLTAKEVIGAHNIKIAADCRLVDIDPKAFSVIILPGGMPGSVNLRDSGEAMAFTSSIYNAGGVAAAICAAPMALAHYGIISAGMTVTCYPGFEEHLQGADCTGAPAEADKRVVTGKGAGASFAFAAKIAQVLGKGEKAAQVLGGMFVKE